MNYKINKRSENDEVIKQRLDEFYNGVEKNITELPQNSKMIQDSSSYHKNNRVYNCKITFNYRII